AGWLNSVRLRAAYGASGVQPGATAALALVQVGQSTLNGVSTPVANLSSLGNPDLKPERRTEFETGVDGELFNQRLRLEATYYNKLSRDALLTLPLSPEVGIATRTVNIGKLRNSGVEALVSATMFDVPVASLTVTLNGSVNRNRVEALNVPNLDFIGSPSYRIKAGYPIGGIFGPRIASIDDDGDGIVEAGEVTLEGDADTYLGTVQPTRQLTLGGSLSLFRNQLRVSTQFDYRGGMVIHNNIGGTRDALGNSRAVNDPTSSLERQAAAIVRNGITGYVENAAFTRWRELSVMYNLPAAVLRRAGASSASITLTGRNLALFTHYSGVDPEGNDGLLFQTEGYADGGQGLPQTRYWMIRLNLGF
ncbi:MAG: TonB-dependent receptor domain-containing protein, partial [Gemmatimonadaceae bacterium]